MQWIDGPIIGFDTETTGTDPTKDRLVSASVVRCVPDAEPEIIGSWLMDAGVIIPIGATAKHGITNDRVRAEGRPPRQVIPALISALTAARDEGLPIAIFNARFDVALLHYEAARLALEPPQNLRILDPLILDKQIDTYRRGKRQLQPTCEVYGVNLEAWHDAGADAIAAAELARAVCRHGGLDSMSLGELHESQVRWAHDQAVDFQQWHHRNGRTHKIIPTGWPLERPAFPPAPTLRDWFENFDLAATRWWQRFKAQTFR